jgi:hypothetical protein
MDLYQLVLFTAVAILVAIVSEVYLGKLYHLVTGKSRWQYRAWVIPGGYS